MLFLTENVTRDMTSIAMVTTLTCTWSSMRLTTTAKITRLWSKEKVLFSSCSRVKYWKFSVHKTILASLSAIITAFRQVVTTQKLPSKNVQWRFQKITGAFQPGDWERKKASSGLPVTPSYQARSEIVGARNELEEVGFFWFFQGRNTSKATMRDAKNLGRNRFFQCLKVRTSRNWKDFLSVLLRTVR